MAGKVIISLPVLIVVFIIIVAGYVLVYKIVYKKWGYTKKREKELEDATENGLFPKHK